MKNELGVVLGSLLITTGALTTSLVSIGCSDGGESAGSGSGSSCGSSTCGAATCGGCGSSTCGGGGAPPEHEDEATYTAPVATGRYVWVANPASGRVAYIDASTLQIRLVEAGNAPTYLAAVPDETDDVAVVLNVLSLDATVLRAREGTVSAASYSVPSSGNAWAVSTKGRWAIAWSDARLVPDADPLDGYQELTVLDLAHEGESFELNVGYRPVALAFDAASTRAFAVTQDGISVVSLLEPDGPTVVKNVQLSDDPLDPNGTRDVAITPDGNYAIVRRDGEANLSIFSLVDASRTDIALPADATDMDLSADGATAVAVLRSTSQIALLPIPGILHDPANLSLIQVDAATVGSTSLAEKSSRAFFYTNAKPNPVLTLIDIAASAPSPSSILLRAPVASVFPMADAKHAVVMHDSLPPDPETGAVSPYAAAFSLVPVALELPAKIVGVRAPLTAIALAPEGKRALLATGDEASGLFELHIAEMPSLKVTTLPLASMPIATGIVAGENRGYVAQKHPEGRITFVDLDSGEARTLTGFELAAQVVDGSEP